VANADKIFNLFLNQCSCIFLCCHDMLVNIIVLCE